MAKQLEAQKKIDSFIYTATNELLQSKAGNLPFTKGPSQKSNLVFREYLSAILLANSDFKLLYMIHFWLEDAKKLANGLLKTDSSEVEYWRAIDFFKEYCNIIAGKAKKAFENIDIQLVQSLPIGISGYNLTLFEEKSVRERCLHWTQRYDQIELDFSTRYSILNTKIINKLATFPQYEDIRDDTESIEFF